MDPLAKHSIKFGKDFIDIWVRSNTKDINIVKEVLEDRVYSQSRLKFDVRPDEMWLDLGAHIGCFSTYVLLMGGRVRAYEPAEENYQILRRNLRRFELGRPKEDVSSHQAVVSAYKNIVLDLYGPTRRVAGVLPNTKYMIHGMSSYVPVGKVVNHHFSPRFLHNVNGIKMDIEGAEAGILDDLPKIPPCVKKMVIEYHFIKDRNLARFKFRMDALRKQFTTVHYPKHLDKFIKEGLEDYPGYFDRLVFCQR